MDDAHDEFTGLSNTALIRQITELAGQLNAANHRWLVQLPALSVAMGEGRLSYSMVRALTRIATPENEATVVKWALHGTEHQIEELVRKWRRVLEVEGDAGVSAGTRHTLRMQRRADTAVLLAESFLAHGPQALKGGDRQQIVVHVDASMLQGGEAHRCELHEGPAIAVETARRLACDEGRTAHAPPRRRRVAVRHTGR